MWKKWVACAMLLIVVTSGSVLADVGGATQAVYEGSFTKMWVLSTGAYSWKMELNSFAAKRIYDDMTDKGAIVGSVGTIFARTGTPAEVTVIIGGLWGLGGIALKKCSKDGTRDVLIYGWTYDVQVLNGNGDLVEEERHIPLWCRTR